MSFSFPLFLIEKSNWPSRQRFSRLKQGETQNNDKLIVNDKYVFALPDRVGPFCSGPKLLLLRCKTQQIQYICK